MYLSSLRVNFFVSQSGVSLLWSFWFRVLSSVGEIFVVVPSMLSFWRDSKIYQPSRKIPNSEAFLKWIKLVECQGGIFLNWVETTFHSLPYPSLPFPSLPSPPLQKSQFSHVSTADLVMYLLPLIQKPPTHKRHPHLRNTNQMRIIVQQS